MCKWQRRRGKEVTTAVRITRTLWQRKITEEERREKHVEKKTWEKLGMWFQVKLEKDTRHKTQDAMQRFTVEMIEDQLYNITKYQTTRIISLS